MTVRSSESEPLAGAPLLDAEAVRHSFEATLGIPFTDGNSVEPLRNGVEIFPAMLAEIEAARERVRLLTFIYWKGTVARRFADVLSERARAGLRVEVLIDDVGSFAMPDELAERMAAAGVRLRRFRPVSRLRLGRVGNRTHRKVLVCDGAVGFTGGVGIAEEWEGDAREPGEWRETHFRVRGPAVRGLEGAFLDNWYESGAPLEEGAASPPLPERGPAAVQVLRSHGLSDRTTILTALRLLVRLSRRSLLVQTAYFVPDDTMREELCAAARRGVRIEVLLPGQHSDHRLCNLAGRSEYAPLLDAGVRISTYERTMLHTKVVLSDDRLALVGSPNFNQRSMRRDDEVAMVVLDSALAERLERDFRADLQHAARLDPATWPERGVWSRAKEWLARTIRPHL